MDVCPSSSKFFFDQSFDVQYKQSIREFWKSRIEKILNSGCRRLVVIDDGGELIHVVNEELDAFRAKNIQISGIEQTSSGFSKLENMNISIPVINVARSKVKLQLESYLIADSIIMNSNLALEEIGLKINKVLIIGNGAIGSKVKEKLNPFYEVDTYDPLLKRSSIPQFEKIDYKQYNLIIGCSGKEVLNSLNSQLLRRETALISGSSSDREFCAVEFRRQMNFIPSCHDNININGIYLINCGFPVNFSEQYHLVDDEQYQLTRALLFAGVLQSLSQEDSVRGFMDLDTDIQNQISQGFLQLYPTYSNS